MKPPIHSTKHYHQITLSTAMTLQKVDSIIINSVEGSVASAANQVEEGSVIKSVYLELWVIGSVSNQFFTIVVSKLPSGLAGPTFTNMTLLNGWGNKKNIFYTTQGLASNDGIAQPIAVHRSWIKIPKGKQRFGLGDRFVLTVASRGTDDIIFCGFATYKEYS